MKVGLQDCQKHLAKKEKNWESLCLRCGACCGSLDDPCVHLKKQNNKYHCEIYSERFGIRKAVSGDIFRCVHIKQLLPTHWKGDHRCPYKKL